MIGIRLDIEVRAVCGPCNPHFQNRAAAPGDPTAEAVASARKPSHNLNVASEHRLDGAPQGVIVCAVVFKQTCGGSPSDRVTAPS